MAKRKKSRWIQGAIKRPGALKAKAKRAGALTRSGTISYAWLQKQARKSGRTAQQARLAMTLGKMRKKKR